MSSSSPSTLLAEAIKAMVKTRQELFFNYIVQVNKIIELKDNAVKLMLQECGADSVSVSCLKELTFAFSFESTFLHQCSWEADGPVKPRTVRLGELVLSVICCFWT